MERLPDRDPSSLETTHTTRRQFMGTVAVMGAAGGISRLIERPAAAAEADGPRSVEVKPGKPAERQTSPRHPLDPLSATELREAVRVLRVSGKATDSFKFVSAVLLEPEKKLVEAYQQGQPIPRQAFVVLLDITSGVGYEATVDLGDGTVNQWKALAKGVQPAIMLDEFGECEEAVKRSPEFLAAMKKRGVENVDLLMVEPWSAGNYGIEPAEDKGRRLMRALCFVRSEPNDNGYARPLDGVVAVVDLNKMEVVRVEDYGVRPLPPEAGNWARQYIDNVRTGLKPLEIVQPEGPSFEVDGNEVRWQKWRFRIGFTPREGLVLHTVSYADGERVRPVVWRASICEMVVPYGDPDTQYFRKNAFDIGEYGIGTLANSLELGCDCLGTIRYFDADALDSRGEVMTIKNAVCLHEEDAGLMWKHTDWRSNQKEARRARRLSASFIATVGNYEYGFYWHFYQDGTLQCEVKLTGILHTTALMPGEKPAYGVEIAKQLNAPLHQHIFAARIDPYVDGPSNRVYEVNTSGIPQGEQNPHGNGFQATATLLSTEQQAKRTTNTSTARFWRIVNPEKLNRLGQPVAYRLIPGENCPAFAQPEASVMKRAGFAAHHLWVTPFQAEERYPAGDYPNQNPGGDGLPNWTADDRNIADTDLVVWYVFSANHVPRLEDWPVMPVASISFQLRPDGFFESNPALDLPS